LTQRATGTTGVLHYNLLATGGTARSLRRVVGRTLGPNELAKAESVLSSAPAASSTLKPGGTWMAARPVAGVGARTAIKSSDAEAVAMAAALMRQRSCTVIPSRV
jgi:hypothetical protein